MGEENVYLMRVYGRHGARNFEEYLLDPKHFLGNLGQSYSDCIPSAIVSEINMQKMDAIEYAQVSNNLNNLHNTASFYFYDNNIDELRERIIALLNQPVGEYSYKKIMNGKDLSAKDCFGYEKPTISILKTTISDLLKLVNKGMCELREGEYLSSAGEMQLSKELTLSDDGLKTLLENNSLLAYDKINIILNNSEIFVDGGNFDENNKFSKYTAGYTPEYRINKLAKEKNVSKKTEFPKFLKNQLDEIKLSLDNCKGEDREIMESAIIDTVLYLAKQNSIDARKCFEYIGIDCKTVKEDVAQNEKY